MGRGEMARKKSSVESLEALKMRLDALQEYIAHHERKLDQLDADVRKFVILDSDPDDLVGFSGSLLHFRGTSV